MSKEQKIALETALRMLGRSGKYGINSRADMIHGVTMVAIPLNGYSDDLEKVCRVSTALVHESMDRGNI